MNKEDVVNFANATGVMFDSIGLVEGIEEREDLIRRQVAIVMQLNAAYGQPLALSVDDYTADIMQTLTESQINPPDMQWSVVGDGIADIQTAECGCNFYDGGEGRRFRYYCEQHQGDKL